MIKRFKFVVDFLILAGIKLILEFNYYHFIYPNFNYEGFKFNFDISDYFNSWFLFCIGYLVIYTKRNLNLGVFYYFIFIIWYIPNLVIYSFLSHSLYSILILLVPFNLLAWFTFNNHKKLKSVKYGKPIVLLISLMAAFVVLINYFISTGGHLNFDLIKVYEQRELYGEESSSGIFGYLNSWTFKIFSVLIFAWSIQQKRKNFIIFATLLIVLLFGFSGHKSSLVGLVIVPFFYFLLKKENAATFMNISILAFLMVSQLIIAWKDAVLFGSIAFRRTFMTPAYLNSVYIEFFSKHPYMYWNDSSFNFWSSQSVYGERLIYVIGSYLNRPDMAANTGFIASGFAQAGIFGIGIYCLIAILILNFIENSMNSLDKFFVYTLVILPLITLFLSSDLPTTLLTHGLILSLLFLFFYKDKKYKVLLGNDRVTI